MLFERCLKSVLNKKPADVEILVNNDTNDITEIPGAMYFYKQAHDISELYKFLFDKATGEYIYFLEDDDYVVQNFYDVVSMNTINEQNTIFKYMPFTGMYDYFDFWKRNTFNYNFQLSQMLFLKKDLTEFPTGNNLQNDWFIYNHVNTKRTFNFTNIPIYYQTTDGKDNISFSEFNSDERFIIDEQYR